MLGVGEVLPSRRSRRRAASLPIDVARTIEELLAIAPLDLVHVHEPFAPSAASAALRHSRALNVGSFHAPTERVALDAGRARVVELFFGRLDARIASYDATARADAALLPRRLPRRPARRRRAALAPTRRAGDGRRRIAFVDDEERARAAHVPARAAAPALRLRLGRDGLVAPRGRRPPAPLRAELRERIAFVGPDDCDEDALLAGADVVVRASSGAAPAPGLSLRALAAGAVPLAARLPVYEEVARRRRARPAVRARRRRHARRPARAPGRRPRAARAPARRRRRRCASGSRWARVADELEDVYAGSSRAATTTAATARCAPASRKRRLIDVDLHMHTDHSRDCATPVEVLLATAKARGLGAIAVTDHNEVSGALEAQREGRAGSR